MKKVARRLVPLILILVLVVVAVWYLFQNGDQQSDAHIQASGTVEALEIKVSPEISGRVLEVYVDKGDYVQAGEALLQIDGEMLNAQRNRAQKSYDAASGNLEAAQASLDLAKATLEMAEANLNTALANSEAELVPAKQAMNDLFENAQVTRAQAEQQVAVATRALREAQYTLDNFTVPSNQQNYTALEAIAVTEGILDKARQEFEPYKYRSSGDPTRDDYKEALDEAQSDYDSAVRRLEYETAVERARALLDKAMRDFEAVQDGPHPDEIARLEARIAALETAPTQAAAAVEQARAGVNQAQVAFEQVEKLVAQAQAELDLIDVQIKKLTVYAGTSGLVLSRNIEPGEVVQAGVPVMTIGDVGNLTITVYVPEVRYGQLDYGMQARVTVDSFPKEQFIANVVYIAEKAEFTPRNVQTAEGRRTTVFAVELAIDNPEGLLKPGMPADVEFEE